MHQTNQLTRIKNKLIGIENRLEKVKEKIKGTREAKVVDQAILELLEIIKKLP